MRTRSPFPGMDPYLEHRAIWPDVHNRLITSLADYITPLIQPKYFTRVESRTYIVRSADGKYLGRPDVSVASSSPSQTIREAAPAYVTGSGQEQSVVEIDLRPPGFEDQLDLYYLEIRRVESHDLITAIEILSPVNKFDQRGRDEFLAKRIHFLQSKSSYIEIDLLRGGEPLPAVPHVISDYRVVVRKGWEGTRAKLYTFSLRSTIPDIPLPLMEEDEEPIIHLNQILHDLYERARFDLEIDYSKPAQPPLTEANQAWANDLLLSNR